MPNPNRGACGFLSSEFEEQYDRPSKSQLKREMTALQKIGEELVASARDRVLRIEIPEDVRQAILECQAIKDHEGRRRQLQFVGKKMRSLTPEELAIVKKTIDSWNGASKSETAALHFIERQRDKLLKDDALLTPLLVTHPHLDAQHMRTLIRNARKEQAENKPPKAYRALFQILKSLQNTKDEANQDDHADDADENS